MFTLFTQFNAVYYNDYYRKCCFLSGFFSFSPIFPFCAFCFYCVTSLLDLKVLSCFTHDSKNETRKKLTKSKIVHGLYIQMAFDVTYISMMILVDKVHCLQSRRSGVHLYDHVY